jgi:hypothetical protein
MPGYNSPRRGTARTVPIYFYVVLCIVFCVVLCIVCYLCCSMYCLFFVLFYVLFVFYVVLCIVFFCRSVYCLCVNVYCTTATAWQPNCSWQIYHIISHHVKCLFMSDFYENRNQSQNSTKHPKYETVQKSIRWKLQFFIRTDAPTDRRDVADSRFLQLLRERT